MRNYRKTPDSESLPVDVVGSSTFGRYAKISVAKTFNQFISEDWLVPFAGYRKVLELSTSGEGRGIYHSVRGNFLLVVISSAVYRIDSNLGYTLIGNLNSFQGEVFMDENLASQICIVDGIDAYIYNHLLPPNLTVQTLPSDLLPNYVSYHNTFFLFGNALTTNDGSKWFAYSFASNTTITEANEFALQTKPDFAIAVKRLPAQGNNVIVFGKSVCEIWTNVGGEQNYRRASAISVDSGCLAVQTISASDENVFWLGTNETNAPVIMMYSGSGASPISSDGIDELLQSLHRPDRSTASIFRQDGHLFYQITFYDAQDNLTLVYDVTTQKFFHLSDEKLDYHPAREMVYFGDSWYFVSLRNGSLYQSSTNIAVIDESLNQTDPEDYIHAIQRIRISSPVRFKSTAPFRVNSFVMPIEQGNDEQAQAFQLMNIIITETGDDEITETGDLIITEDSISSNSDAAIYAPRVDLSFSKDGGITWSNTKSKRLNPIAHRKNILNYNSMGACNEITFKLRFWGYSRFLVNDATIEVY